MTYIDLVDPRAGDVHPSACMRQRSRALTRELKFGSFSHGPGQQLHLGLRNIQDNCENVCVNVSSSHLLAPRAFVLQWPLPQYNI